MKTSPFATLSCLAGLLVASLSLHADSPLPRPAKATEPGDSKWGFLGNDANLLHTVEDCDEAILGCVYRVEYTDVSSSFATANLHITVAQTYKGKLKAGERVVVVFPIELSGKGADPRKELDAMSETAFRYARICFLNKLDDGRYETEWCNIPKFTSSMNDFLEEYRLRNSSTQ